MSSLSKVIVQLTRAQHGAAGQSIPQGLEGAELDKYVAELLMADARSNSTAGAYARSDSEPETKIKLANKRFLNNVIRDVSFRNRALIQAEQQLQASGSRAANREQSSSRRRDPDDRFRDRDVSHRLDGRNERNRTQNSAQDRNHKSQHLKDDRSGSPERQHERQKLHAERERPRSSSKSRPPPPSSEPPPLPHDPRPMTSKMDRYFEPNYDPGADHALLRHAKNGELSVLPKLGGGNGPISDQEFDAWSTMLSVLEKRKMKESNSQTESSNSKRINAVEHSEDEVDRKQRKLEKKRRKAAELLGHVETPEERAERKRKSKKEKESKSFGFGTAGTSLTKSQEADFYWSGKGGEREWDMGKSEDLSF